MTPQPIIPELSYVQQTILDCVRAFDGKLQRSEIAKVLRGSESVRVATRRESVFFGRLSRIKRRSLMHHIDVLLQQHYLEQDGFDRVLLAERGRDYFLRLKVEKKP